MTKFLKNADVTGYISQTSVTSSLVKTDANGKIVAATAGTDYQAPTTALLPIGGTAGQILSKIDATNYNTQWIDNFAAQLKHEVKLGATLAKGKAVYVSSADGTNMIVSAASNASEATSSKTLGLLETGGVTNDKVKVITEGLLAGLDTSTATAGDPVWLGTGGDLLFGLVNKPVAPAHMVFIGIVTRVQSNNGEIFVKVQNGFELNEIHDVSISSLANNQTLVWESATSLWKNKTIAAALGFTPADDSAVVKLTGDQTVAGVKTFTSVVNAPTLSLNGGVLAGNNIVSMRSNPTGGQFRIEKSDGSLSAYPFYIGADGTALAYYYNAAGALKVLLHTDNTSYFGNSLSVGYASYAATSYMLDVNGTSRFTNTVTIGNFDTLALRMQAGTSTGSSYLRFFNSAGTARGYFGLFWSGTSDYMVMDAGALEMNFGSSNKFTFTGGGAATFSGALSTAGDVTIATGSIKLYTQQNVSGQYRYIGTEYSSGNGNNKAEIRFVIDGSDTKTKITFHTANGGGQINEVMGVYATGQFKLNNYTSATSYTGTAAGYLAFDSSGNVITVAGVAATDDTKLPLAGGTMTGNIIYSPGDATDWYLKGPANGPTIRMRYSGGTTNRNAALGWVNNTPSYSDILYWTDSIVTANVPLTGTSATFSGTVTSTATTNNFIAQSDGNTAIWRGRILSKNSTSDKAAFLGTYGSIAGVFSHNNALDAWAALYVNNVDGSNGGNVYLPTNSYVASNVILHAGNYSSYALPLSGGSLSGQLSINNGTSNALSITTTVADGTTRDGIYLYENSGQASGRQAISWYNGGQSYYKARIWTEVGSGYNATQFGIDVANDARVVATRLYIRNGDVYISNNAYANGNRLVENTGTWSINVTGSSGTSTSAGRLETGNNQWTWSTGAHTATNPNSITLWDQYASNGGSGSPGTYATILDIYGRSAHEHDQLFFDSSGNILHRNCFYGTNTWNGWRTMLDSSNAGYAYNMNQNVRTTDSPSFQDGIFGTTGGATDQGIQIRYQNYASGYGRIRFYQSDSNHSTIHSFSNSWQNGSLAGHSSGAINIEGNTGVTIGAWNNADMWIDKSGNAQARGSMRAPIFYDSNDTTYYLNPAGDGTRAGYFNGNIWINPKPESYGEGISFLMPNQSTWGGLRWTRSTTNFTGAWAFGYFGNEANNDIGFHNGTNGWRLDQSFNMTVNGSVRSPIYYDSENTGYYGDFASTSRFNYIVPNKIKCVGNVNYEPRWDFSAYVVEAQHWYGNDGSMTMYIGESNPVDIRGYVFNSSGNFRVADTLYVDNHVDASYFYSRGWLYSQGNAGWHNDTYNQGLRQAKVNVTYGSVITEGENYNGWGGYNITNTYLTCFMQNSSGTHGFYQEGGGDGWTLFYNFGYKCWGMGTDATDPSYSLHIPKYGGSNTGWIIWSDRRIKENITTIDNALDKVLALRGVYYNKIDDPNKERQVGYIAQEVKEVVPELVVYSEELDMYNMNYAPMVGVLTEAIKEQQSQIETLKEQVQTLLTHINNGI